VVQQFIKLASMFVSKRKINILRMGAGTHTVHTAFVLTFGHALLPSDCSNCVVPERPEVLQYTLLLFFRPFLILYCKS